MWPQTYKFPFVLNDASILYLSHECGIFRQRALRKKKGIYFANISPGWHLREENQFCRYKEWDIFIFNERIAWASSVIPNMSIFSWEEKPDWIFQFFDEKVTGHI